MSGGVFECGVDLTWSDRAPAARLTVTVGEQSWRLAPADDLAKRRLIARAAMRAPLQNCARGIRQNMRQ